ncbi:MAG: hypothetical protein ACRDEA_07195 [Microcystaceae cyanobacterium]
MIPLLWCIPRVSIKLALWLFLELTLNACGLDTLADFGEFVFSNEIYVQIQALAKS